LIVDQQISAIVIAYNLERFIGEAVASIQAQSRPVQEIIIVDDGSADQTPEIVQALARSDPRIRPLACERGGPSGARNRGLQAATGGVVAFLDGDDAWPRDKIERQMARFSAGDRPEIVSGLIQRFRTLDPVTLTPLDEVGDSVPGPNVGACLFRHAVFSTVGPFDSSLIYSEDQDLMLRIREAGLKIAIVNSTTLYYRRRAGSLTKAADAPADLQWLRVLRRSVARRRRAGGNLHLDPLSKFRDR
jgi:glycosyltransferase involved in cell wall biosynthesis